MTKEMLSSQIEELNRVTDRAIFFERFRSRFNFLFKVASSFDEDNFVKFAAELDNFSVQATNFVLHNYPDTEE